MERVRSHLSTPGDQPHQPAGFSASPSPLSCEVDEIVEYMRFIGERRTQTRA